MTELPFPLTPPDCDCKGLPFMPLEQRRLLDSDFVALTSGDEFKAGVLLWCASWEQQPAASLPSDDRLLARLAGCALADWKVVREMALHNWVLCNDGRLYHPIIADHAAKAATNRRSQANRSNTRWARERAAKEAADMPRECHGIATEHAAAMQVEVKVEGEVRTEASASVARAGAPKPPKARRRCPTDFLPSPAVIRFAETEGLTAGEIERELAKMKDHEFRSPRSDWDAACRNWFRTAAENRRNDRSPTSAKQTEREANYARSLAGAADAARRRA